MKKVLLAGAALMLVGGIASTASAAAVEPGVKITGDARARLWYKSEEYSNLFGNLDTTGGYDSQTNMDSRVRLNITGTTAGGTYVKARIRLMESLMGDIDKDLDSINNEGQNDIWTDQAYIGIPFNDMFTLELGKYRSTYGPLPLTYNFFYDDVNLTGLRGIVKIDNIEINPFVEWMDEAQNTGATGFSTANTSTTLDKNQDNDERRYGAHIKAKVNQDWTLGGMLGYQSDDRVKNYTYTTTTAATPTVPSYSTTKSGVAEPNEGFFGSIYANGKVGAFGLVTEFGYTAAELNGFNTWAEDSNGADVIDSIGSKDDGFGGYIYPTYTIDKLTLGVNAGFTADGYRPDRAYGFVMIGGKDNSVIGDSVKIGETGDWLWGGLVVNYKISDALNLTGNIVYADIDSATHRSDALAAAGQGDVPYTTASALDSAWELSAVLQYTITKGTDIFFSAGYLKPDFDDATLKEDDAEIGIASRLEVKF